MDATRREAGNDTPWKGKPARTYKHYVLSPDPGDRIELDDLRRLTMAWVRENFADFEKAVYFSGLLSTFAMIAALEIGWLGIFSHSPA